MNNPSVIGPDVKKSVLNKDFVSKILSSVTEEKGFHFYLAIGEPTGKTAVSLADFVEKLESVALQSINFHYPRRDFEMWIREIFGDGELALRIGRIGKIRVDIKGESLRYEIIRTMKMRLNEIKPLPPATSKPPVFGGTPRTERTTGLF